MVKLADDFAPFFPPSTEWEPPDRSFDFAPWSMPVIGGGGAAVPAAPANLIATGVDSEVDLTWDAVSGATSYSVYRGLTPGGESGTAIATGVLTASYADTAKSNGVTYYYYVTATNATGESLPSTEASAAPVPTTYLLDHFTDANATALASHTMDTGAGWSVESAGFTISSNRAVRSAGIAGAWADAGHADVTITCTLRIVAGGLGGLRFRVTDASNFFVLFIDTTSDGGSYFQIFKVESGSYSVIASSYINFTTGVDYALTVQLSSNDIKILLDGATTVVVTSSFNATATKFGLHNHNGSCQWDDFKVTKTAANVVDASKPLVIADGNSLTMGVVGGGVVNVQDTYSMQLMTSLGSGYQFGGTSGSVTGRTTATMLSDITAKLAPIIAGQPSSRRIIVIAWELTNSFAAGQTAVQINTTLTSYVSTVKGLGANVRVIVPNMIDRVSFDPAPTVNPMVALNAFAADAVPNVYQDEPDHTGGDFLDGIHLNPAGYTKIAARIKTAVLAVT